MTCKHVPCKKVASFRPSNVHADTYVYSNRSKQIILNLSPFFLFQFGTSNDRLIRLFPFVVTRFLSCFTVTLHSVTLHFPPLFRSRIIYVLLFFLLEPLDVLCRLYKSLSVLYYIFCCLTSSMSLFIHRT